MAAGFCVSCGAALSPGSRFCSSCGAPAGDSHPASPGQGAAWHHPVPPAFGGHAPDYQSGHRYPRKSRAGLFIGLAVGTLVVLGLLFHFIFVDNAWLDGSSSESSDYSSTGSTDYSSASSTSASGSQTGPTGRWCSAQGTLEFRSNGDYVEMDTVTGRWFPGGTGQVTITVNGRSAGLRYARSGNALTVFQAGGPINFASC